MAAPFPVALVGVGKIARDQHIPAIAGDADFELVAGVSRHATIEGVANFPDLDSFLAEGPAAAVALCVPPERAHGDGAEGAGGGAGRAAGEAAGGDAWARWT